MLAFHLRDAGSLAGAVGGIVNLLPEAWRQSLIKSSKSVPLPSASTLSRARLFVDVALMLWMRERHAALLGDLGLKLLVKLDWTPMAGNSWEVVEYEAVRGEDLARAGDLVSSLAQ